MANMAVASSLTSIYKLQQYNYYNYLALLDLMINSYDSAFSK